MRPDLAVRGQLRDRVLGLAAELGWRPAEAMAFAKGVTGRRWEDCAVADLAIVEAEYLAIRQAIEEKRRRRCARTTDIFAGYPPRDPM